MYLNLLQNGLVVHPEIRENVLETVVGGDLSFGVVDIDILKYRNVVEAISMWVWCIHQN